MEQLSMSRMAANMSQNKPGRILVIGYNTLAEARAKGLIWEDEASLNVWYNPGNLFDRSLIFIPFGRTDIDELLTPSIRYVEWSFKRSPRAIIFLRVLYRLVAAIRFICFVIKREKIDVIRANGPHLPSVLVFVVLLVKRVPSVLFIEAFWEKLLPSQSYFPRWLKRLLPLWYRLLYRSFDSYTGTPSVDPEYFISKGMPRNRIAPWTHELDIDALLKRVNTITPPVILNGLSHPRLVAVGRLHREKHPDDLIKLVSILRQRHVHASLVLVGDGEERTNLEGLARSLGVEDAVLFTGVVSQAEGLAIASVCDIYTAPMQGNALVEAMSIGLPIVAYDHAWHRNLLKNGETGLLVPYRDMESMATAIEALWKEPTLSKKMGEAARKHTLHVHGTQQVAQVLAEPYYRAWLMRNPNV